MISNVYLEDACKIISGDAKVELKKLPDKTFQCCITSPPYGIT